MQRGVLTAMHVRRAPAPTVLARRAAPARRRSPVWTTPLRRGTLPAFDEALKYIRRDSLALRGELAAEKTRPADARREERLHTLAVQSEINLPEVRHAFRTGRFPFQRPVYRHLAEQAWRRDGTLDLLMERLHQMHVVPDVLPALRPTLDLRVQFPAPRPRTAHAAFATVEPGVFLPVPQTLAPPRIAATAFHSGRRLYTLLMVDPDVPDQTQGTYTTYLHWMHPNIALSAAPRARIAPVPHLPYVPPHPQRGSGYHRYVLLLLAHPPDGTPLPIPVPRDEERLGFDVRAFVARWGLALDAGGACMWRAVWEAAVGDVYRDVLKTAEPRFGHVAKPERESRRRYGV